MKKHLLTFGILFGFALFIVACGNAEQTAAEETEAVEEAAPVQEEAAPAQDAENTETPAEGTQAQ